MTRFLSIIALSLCLILGLFLRAHATRAQHGSLPQAGYSEQLRSGIFFVSDKALNPELKFEDHTGAALTSSSFQGNYHIFFFGYSTCPSFCPEIVQKMSDIAQASSFDHWRFVFVSIDPENDTPEQLSTFLHNYPSEILGLRGSFDVVEEMAEYFRVHVGQARGEDGHIAHSASLVVLDPQGRACGLLSDLEDPNQVAKDCGYIQSRLATSIK